MRDDGVDAAACPTYNPTNLIQTFVPEIPITRPFFDEEEERRVRDVLRSGWVAQGPQVAAFERAFADRCGAAHAVACANGTAALHLALLAVGIGPGDEVLVPSFTWIATANAVRFCGGTPVLCDIDLRTFNLDVADAQARATDRTRAIVPVHQFGLPADMDAVHALAADHGWTVVGDAACAFGATYHDRPAGTLAPLESFSFHPRKSITTGEGGMVTTQDADVAAQLRSLRNHGPALDGVFPASAHTGQSLLADVDRLGYNYRLTDLQAAVGLAQLEKADAILAARREQAAYYDAALANVDWLLTPQTPADRTHGYQSYAVLMAGPHGDAPTLDDVATLNARRNGIIAKLDAAGIQTRQGTHAVHTLRLYAEGAALAPEALPHALLADRLSFALPLFPGLTTADQDQVVDALRAAHGAVPAG